MLFTSTSRLIVDYFLLVDYFISRLLVDYRLVDGSLSCHTTQWNTNAGKPAINDYLQGTVATYLSCGGVGNDQIKNGLLLSLSVKEFLKSANMWQRYNQERGCLMHFVAFLCAWPLHY